MRVEEWVKIRCRVRVRILVSQFVVRAVVIGKVVRMRLELYILPGCGQWTCALIAFRFRVGMNQPSKPNLNTNSTRSQPSLPNPTVI